MMSMASAQSANPIQDGQPGSSGRVDRLVQVVQEVSSARLIERVQEIVRSAARELTGADGATFVLRDGNQCYYADEDAIAPLWKGKRFPMSTCVSGWAMMNRQSTILPDVFDDPRVPVSVYRATFVKSMAMMPIRKADPVGAIGVYWATPHHATPEEMQLLEALANTTAVALENVRLYAQLNARIDDLQRAHHELERFTWVSFHDFQEPLRMIATHSDLLERASGAQLDERHRRSLGHVREGERRLRRLTTSLAEYVDIREPGGEPGGEQDGEGDPTDMVAVVQQALGELAPELVASDAEVEVGELPRPVVSSTHLRRLFVHLIGNAIKFCRPGEKPHIAIRGDEREGEWRFSVADNGLGLDEEHRERVFGFFERLHPQDLYPGSGLGLPICRKIVKTLGGHLTVESDPARGSTFTFTIPRPLLTEEPAHGS